MSSQPGPSTNMKTDEKYRIWQFEKEKFDKLNFMYTGTYVDSDHKNWAAKEGILQNWPESTNQGAAYQPSTTPQFDQGNKLPVRSQSESPNKWAWIHDPTNGFLKGVEVIEDTGTGVNFISPRIAEACNLTPYSTTEVCHTVMTGHTFTSKQYVKVYWIGSGKNHNEHEFYLAPELAPIELLVGKKFLNENADVFMATKPLTKPTFLNVQGKIRNDEKVEIQANQTAAAAQSAELEEKKKQERQQKQKQKQLASSSKRDSSSKKRKN